MLSHLGLNVPDLGAAADYYGQVLPLVGYEHFSSGEAQLGYRPANDRPGPFLFLYAALDPRPYSGEGTGLQHVAFAVRTRGEVDAVHDLVRGLAGTILAAPRVWPEYSDRYYATFWHDPFGFKLETVCVR